MDPAVNVVLAWAAFAVLHSLTVSEGYERLARRVLGEGAFARWHRLLFTLYSGAALLLVLQYLRTLPDGPLYRAEGALRILLHLVQAAGAAVLFWTPWDLLEFVGFRQAVKPPPSKAEASERPRLFTHKAYGVVRHPLYLGCSLIVLFHPVQTRISLVSALMIALYFYAGSFFEERRMVRTFGEEYRRYQREVPRIIPSIGRMFSRRRER